MIGRVVFRLQHRRCGRLPQFVIRREMIEFALARGLDSLAYLSGLDEARRAMASLRSCQVQS
jgi:hypothetical protein